MSLTIHVVDAFTDRPFAGNPAAVCLLQQAADESWLQQVAMEMNLSETAFLLPQGEACWQLRWFTPKIEVDLCGHATLASAHCTLGPYWGERLGKTKMLAYQASARGGTLGINLMGDRVRLRGRAVTTLRGQLDA